MSKGQTIIPHQGIDLDNDEVYISEARAAFIKNLTYEVNGNGDAAIAEGANAGIFTPLESNTRLANLTLPEGRNFCCGFYESKELAEGYVCGWNSNGNHFIYRINGRTGDCQMVKIDKYFNFQLVPKYFISQTRCVLQTVSFFNKSTGKEETRKYLIITDDYNPQRFISVEDSIATNGFDPVLFPYFKTNDLNCERKEWINLGVPPPMDCIEVVPVKRDISDEAERQKANLMNYNGWQFRIKFTDVWGRDSEHGEISDRYFPIIGGGCVSDSSGLPRCVKLKFKAGCPFVDKISIEYRTCTGNTPGLSIDSDWYLYEVINKYNDCGDTPWYERSVNNAYQTEYDRLIVSGLTAEQSAKKADSFLKYNEADNRFEYTFCANKAETPIPVSETNRSYNPMPTTSGTVLSIAKNIVLGRNRRGYEPLDCKELEKIDFVVNKPASNAICMNPKLKKITVWAVIWNDFEDAIVELREDTGTPVFGISNCSRNNAFTYKQTLPKEQEGFIGYLAGTKYYAISKQYLYDRNTGKITYQGLKYSPPSPFDSRYMPVQKFELEVLPGKYVFRVSGHRSSPSDEYQKTSTYLIGQTSLNSLGVVVNETNELVINACDADVEIKDQPLMIYDLTRIGKGCTVAEATNVVEGYLREDEINKYPIELARISPNHEIIYRKYTDHNGHYFAATRQKGQYCELYGTKNCVPNKLLATSDVSYDDSDVWYRYNELYAYKAEEKYPEGDRFLIKGNISLCGDTGIGITGALVVLTRGQSAYADANGNYSIIAHDKGDSGTRDGDKLIYSQRGTCQLLNCDGSCAYCFPDTGISSVPCSGTERIRSVAGLQVKINGLNQRGPQMGGRYALGATLHDWLGRESYIQSRDRHFLDIPSFQETKVFAYSTMGFTMNPDILLPRDVKYISFSITENLNYDDFLTWVAERVQFVDNTGNTNTEAPTQIRLYYEGLGEYNKQNNFSTNTVWQFLTPDEAVVQGDQVEFLINGDGAFFNKRITSLVKYDKEGKYISIDYNDELKDLKDGVLIKLLRPNQNTKKEFYYRLCPMIRVIDGVPQVLSGTFNFFDSYLQNRQIPVPVEVKKTNDSSGEIETTMENQLRNFPYLFEHHSPSDFWGDHCTNKGKVSVKNPYENEQVLKTEFAVSAALANGGILNGLHYFTEQDRISFDEQEWGGITGAVADINNILIICERKNFVVVYDDSAIKVDENGNVYAPSANKRFGRPQKTGGNNYGCDLEDINTIRESNGIVMFLDRSESDLIRHDFSVAKGVASLGFKSWIKRKIKHIIEFNAQGNGETKYFHGVINPKNKNYLLTSFVIRQGDNMDEDFINEETGINIEKSETLSFNIYSSFLEFLSYCPEYFGSMTGDSKDNQLFSIRRGEAWFHHSGTGNGKFNTFFGTECDWFMEPVANMDNTKVKQYLWMEVYCPQIRVYADRIVTEKSQQSRLMPRWWDRRDKFWTADFKCDLNTPSDDNMLKDTTDNSLLDGNVLSGRWLKVRLRPHPKDRTKYFEMTAVIINMNASEKSGT